MSEHYCCFSVYHKESRAEQVSDTVYFKHKCITMPTVTKADAVIKAAKEVAQSIKKHLPSEIPATNFDVLNWVSEIFDDIAKKKVPEEELERPAELRVLEPVTVPRVQENDAMQKIVGQKPQQVAPPRVHDNHNKGLIVASTNGGSIVASAPLHNTRSCVQPMTITQEVNNAMLVESNFCISQANIARRKDPHKLLCEFVGAVLDKETGELMEYWHLMSNPKYCDVWSRSSGNEIGRLVQGMP